MIFRKQGLPEVGVTTNFDRKEVLRMMKREEENAAKQLALLVLRPANLPPITDERGGEKNCKVVVNDMNSRPEIQHGQREKTRRLARQFSELFDVSRLGHNCHSSAFIIERLASTAWAGMRSRPHCSNRSRAQHFISS